MNKYVNGVLVDLTPEEISQREAGAIIASEEQARQARIDEMNVNLKYLSDTDWYVTRLMETSVAIPTQVSTDRALARDNIDAIKLELGL